MHLGNERQSLVLPGQMSDVASKERSVVVGTSELVVVETKTEAAGTADLKGRLISQTRWLKLMWAEVSAQRNCEGCCFAASVNTNDRTLQLHQCLEVCYQRCLGPPALAVAEGWEYV